MMVANGCICMAQWKESGCKASRHVSLHGVLGAHEDIAQHNFSRGTAADNADVHPMLTPPFASVSESIFLRKPD